MLIIIINIILFDHMKFVNCNKKMSPLNTMSYEENTDTLWDYFFGMHEYVFEPSKMKTRCLYDDEDAKCLDVCIYDHKKISDIEYAGFYYYLILMMSAFESVEFTPDIWDAREKIKYKVRNNIEINPSNDVDFVIVFTDINFEAGKPIKIEDWQYTSFNEGDIFNVELPTGYIVSVSVNEFGQIDGFAPLQWRFYASKTFREM